MEILLVLIVGFFVCLHYAKKAGCGCFSWLVVLLLMALIALARFGLGI